MSVASCYEMRVMHFRGWIPSLTRAYALLLLFALGSGWTMGCESPSTSTPRDTPLTVAWLSQAFPAAASLLARAEERPVALAAASHRN